MHRTKFLYPLNPPQSRWRRALRGSKLPRLRRTQRRVLVAASYTFLLAFVLLVGLRQDLSRALDASVYLALPLFVVLGMFARAVVPDAIPLLPSPEVEDPGPQPVEVTRMLLVPMVPMIMILPPTLILWREPDLPVEHDA